MAVGVKKTNETESQFIAIGDSNVAVRKHENHLLLAIDLGDTVDVTTKGGASYIAKVTDRQIITIDGKEYSMGLWFKANNPAPSRKAVSL